MTSPPEVTLPPGLTYVPSLARQVTSAALSNKPIYNWFYFAHSFSPDLVKKLIEYWREEKTIDAVLDPFVGAGTTLLTARELGLSAVGTDLSPLSVLVTAAKLHRYNRDLVTKAVNNVVKEAKKSRKFYKTEDLRLSKALTALEYTNLLRLRAAIYNQQDNGLLLLAFLRIVQQTSRALADGGWFRWVEKEESGTSVFERFQLCALEFAVDIDSGEEVENVSQRVFLADARQHKFEKGAFDAVITSPPYPNRHDYTRVFHLELLLGANISNDELKQLRYNTLRSHVEAKPPIGFEKLTGYREPRVLSKLIDGVNTDFKPRIDRMMRGYLEDIYLSLRVQHHALTTKGKVALVVSNVRHGGVMFPVDELIADVALQVGFEWNGTWVARYRGNSSQQMATYGREPTRESIVLLSKP